MIGQTFGSYRAVRVVGRGGMGVVYAAEHPLLGSQAVVKQLRPELSAQRDLIERFFNEARAASRIKHPGIVSIFDFGYSADGTAYFVMEYLEGESVTARLARSGPLAEAHAARLGRQIAGALAAAHEAGIVHRDLKPDNVFLVPDEAVAGGERAKILDFGIAKLGGEAGEGVAVTRTGALLGSPLYMSPEQCRGTGEVDARSDIYALGCLLFAMVCGRPPFVGEGVGEIIGKHIYEQPPRPRELAAGLSGGLEAVILQALEKDPARRQPSMRAFAAALEGAAGEAGAGAAETAAAASGRPAADDPARLAATADTILSTAPEAAPTVPAVVTSEVPAAAASGAAASGAAASGAAASGAGRQRTVAMWIAAALAAGMAGFFLLARVDDRGAGAPAGAPPRVDQAVPSGAVRAPEPSPAGGGGPSAAAAEADHMMAEPPAQGLQAAPATIDAGPADQLAGTAPPDAGPPGKRTARKRRAGDPPANVSRTKPAPPESQRRNAMDEEAPEQTPPQRAAE